MKDSLRARGCLKDVRRMSGGTTMEREIESRHQHVSSPCHEM